MADLEYRIVIRDDGTATVKRVETAVKELQTTAQKPITVPIEPSISPTKAAQNIQNEIDKIKLPQGILSIPITTAPSTIPALQGIQSELQKIQSIAKEPAIIPIKSVGKEKVKGDLEELVTTAKKMLVVPIKSTGVSEVQGTIQDIRSKAIKEPAIIPLKSIGKEKIEGDINQLAMMAKKLGIVPTGPTVVTPAVAAPMAAITAATAQTTAATQAATIAAQGHAAAQTKVGQAATVAGVAGATGGKAAAKGQKEAAGEASNFHRALERLNRTLIAFIGIWAFREILSGFKAMVSTGIEYNSTLEQSRLGIASILTAQGQFINAQGEALQGTQALNAAQVMSTKITKQLQMDNLETAATYKQLVTAYQQTLAPGLEVGFDPEQIRKYTVAMVQAASAMGMNLDMLAEETRSMLRGTITPRNTLIATALGIRPEDITKYKGDVKGLYDFVMTRLAAFGTAGVIAQTTWVGVLSNIKDTISQVLGVGFEGFFDFIKQEMINLQNYLIVKTPEGLQPNPEVVAYFRGISDTLKDIVQGAKDFAIALADWKPVLGTIYETAVLIDGVIRNMPMPKPNEEDKAGPFAMFAMLDENMKKLVDFLNRAERAKKEIEEIGKYIEQTSEREDINLGKSMRGEVAYKARPPQYDEATLNSILKLRAELGVFDDRDLESATKIGAKELEIIGTLKDKAGIYSDIIDLTDEQRAKLSLIAREMEIAKWFPEDKPLFLLQAAQLLDEIKLKQWKTAEDLKLQVAEQNKNYSQQIELIEIINRAEISRLNINRAKTGMTDEIEAAMNAAAKAKAEAVKRQQISEPLGYREEIANAQAAMAGMRGDTELQVKLEKDAVDLVIQKRIVNLDLRGEYGKQVSELLKLKSAYEGILKISNARLEKEISITTLKSNIAELTGNYQLQASLLFEANEKAKEKLYLEGKLGDLLGAETAYLMDQNTILKFRDTILKGDVELQKKRIDLESRLATAGMDQVGVYKAMEDNLEQDVRLLQAMADAIDGMKFPELKTQLENLVRLTKEIGPMEIAVSKTKDINAISDQFAKLEQQIAELTGNTQEYDRATQVLVNNQKAALLLDPKTAPYAEGLSYLIDEMTRLNKLTVEFNRLQSVAQLKSDIAELAGSWEGVKNAEQELLYIETQRKLLLGGLTEEGKRYAEEYYRLKTAEIKANQELSMHELADIGMKKYALQSTKELAAQYENTIPNAINMSTNAIGNFFYTMGTTGKASFQDFFKSLHQGFIQLLVDIQMAIIKFEIMNALGYGKGGSSWFSTFLMAGSTSGAGVGTAASTEAAASAAGYISFQHGGLVTKPTLALIGENGPEMVTPLNKLNKEKITNQLTIDIPVEANGYDPKFVSQLRSDLEDVVEKIVVKNLRRYS